MPELPEVETLKLGLQKYCIGHNIIDCDIRTAKLFQGDSKVLRNAKVIAIRRFAKVLSLDFSNNYSLLIHVKMTGQLIYRGPNLKKIDKPSSKLNDLGGKHTHVIFILDNGGKLYYNDVRKFGWLKLINSSKIGEFNFIKKLGPEPFGKLTPKLFDKIMKLNKKPVKAVLMDQEKIGGVGNIYANEALWLARVNPSRQANSLSTTELKNVYQSLLKVLKKGIETGGTSEISYVHADGTDGSYQKKFLVYGQVGKPCRRCQTTIAKITLGGRGTYFCSVCQQ